MAMVHIERYEANDRLLPPVCMLCGAPAAVQKRKAFAWHPPWVLALILVGLLPFAIVAICLTKRMTVYAPLCHDHRNHWTWRAWFLWGGLLFFAVLGVTAIALLTATGPRQRQLEVIGGLLCAGTAVAGLSWLVAAVILQNVGIHPTQITDRALTLTNVAPAFVEALWAERDREEQAARHERPRRPRGPRRPRPDDGAYREGRDYGPAV
jgi:hypothetical protein